MPPRIRVPVRPSSAGRAATRSRPTAACTTSAAALSETVIIEVTRSRLLIVTGSASAEIPVAPGVRPGGTTTGSRGSSRPSSTARQYPTSTSSL
ncbi:hypothetical protein Ae168Ps1_3928c [Pseudonocardia sp. Ae168_Ps1]|nr:hypothetical protein Ae150APs1_3905c [Pseudonocardia sp. Ae150A_Ps1]OLL81522.1 hypothetical protein Ae168Ps1_3928c [Pseudonocardia sp. Ae168_Ps1]OLL84365.1 hypothetical protein Ae263Ps1_1420 [Pseudonocardia sp. Ae263_Ps1]